MILVLKTDTPEAYVAIFMNGQEKVAKTWDAGRELSVQLLSTIEKLCKECDSALNDIQGIVIFEGPGSYTGLRISVSTVNAIGSSLQIPVVGTKGESWLKDGLDELERQRCFIPVTPVYGGEVYTTKPRK